MKEKRRHKVPACRRGIRWVCWGENSPTPSCSNSGRGKRLPSCLTDHALTLHTIVLSEMPPMSLPRHLTYSSPNLESGAVSPAHCITTMTVTLGPEFNQHLLVQSAETALGHKDLRGQVLAKVTGEGERKPKHRACQIPGQHLTPTDPNQHLSPPAIQALLPQFAVFSTLWALLPWTVERILVYGASASNKSSSLRENQQKRFIPHEEL